MADDRRAVPAALIGDLPGDDLPEQLDLLGLPATQTALADGQAMRRGRPAGALNRATAEWVEWLRARYPDPMVRLAQLAFAPPLVLAQELGMKAGDVLAEQRKMLADLLPYFHTRQPIAVDLTNRRVIHLTIEAGGEGELGGGAIIDADPLGEVAVIAPAGGGEGEA